MIIVKEMVDELKDFVSLSIQQILEATKGILLLENDDANYFENNISINICEAFIKNKFVLGVTTDSRNVLNGELFIPLKGAHFDAHEFIPQVFLAGAICVLTEKKILVPEGKFAILVQSTFKALGDVAAYYRSLFEIPIVAITGSVGKTTTKEMIASVLSKKYNVLKTEGNFNNEIGLPLSIFRLNKSHEAAVFEMGMSGLGEIERLSEIGKPDIGVITNVGMSHIEKLGSRENILKAKMELAHGLKNSGTLFLNIDDEMLSSADCPKGVKTIYFGIKKNAKYIAKDILLDETGTRFKLVCETGEFEIFVELPGIHNVHNALAAFAVGMELKVEPEKVIKGISEFNPGKMRMEIFEKDGVKIINDSYNASPQSMKAAMEVLKQFKEKRKIAVLGDMLELGEWSEQAHEMVGEAAKDIDMLVCIGKYAMNTAKGARKSGFNDQMINLFQSNDEASKFLKSQIMKNDVILFKASRGSKVDDVLTYLLTNFFKP